MKFFWKLFLCIAGISAVFFGLGSWYLIDAGYDSSVRGEERQAADDGGDLRNLLSLRIAMETQAQHLSNPAQLSAETWEKLQTELMNRPRQNVAFNLYDADGTLLIDSGLSGISTPATDGIAAAPLPDGGKPVSGTVKADGETYVYALTPIRVMNTVFYAENFRSVAMLDRNRTRQVTTCLWLMGAMAGASCLFAAAASGLLMKPVRALSAAARRMADGDLSTRVEIRTRDEIGVLGRDFNAMAGQLEQTVDALTDAARRQESFVGNFAHELKTPLTSIMGYADLLRSKRVDEERLVLSANYIFEESRRLEQLSMKLLDLIVLKKVDIPLRAADMAQLLTDAAEQVRITFAQEGIALSCEAAERVVPADADLLKTVLLNLLDNARKAVAAAGRADGAVAVRGYETAQGYAAEITDNGIGMVAEELPRITEAFYMADKSRARRQGGAGLGLTLCAEILRLHGAALEFKSAPGMGTTVRMVFPKTDGQGGL
ncbi:MAG: HAMP domain-containing sensor histidine kinase [Oscillospiraceae bacterium]